MLQTRVIFLSILILTLLFMIAVVGGKLATERRREAQLSARQQEVATVVVEQAGTLTTVAQQLALTSTPDRLATLQLEATQARADDEQLLDTAAQWLLIFEDRFVDNSSGWRESKSNPTWSNGKRYFEAQQYIWQIDAIDDFYWLESPANSAEIDDFYLTIDIEREEAGIGTAAVLFRFVDSNNFYYFGLCDGDQYYAGRRHDGVWRAIISCLPSAAIVGAGPNRLAVIAEDHLIRLYINNRYVNSFRDNNLAEGALGVLIEFDRGDENRIKFDNIEVRAP